MCSIKRSVMSEIKPFLFFVFCPGRPSAALHPGQKFSDSFIFFLQLFCLLYISSRSELSFAAVAGTLQPLRFLLF
jgi:hypothetical protein